MKEIKCSKLSLTYKSFEGASAICFEHGGRDWIVDPCVLWNGVLGSDACTYMPLLFQDANNLNNRKASYYVKQAYDGNSFFWTVKQLRGEAECRLEFGFKKFLQQTEEALIMLYNDMAEKRSTVYDGCIKAEEITKIFNQLKVSNLFFMPDRLRSSEITEEKLHFECPKIEDDENSCEMYIPYVLRIGNREIASYISDWSNDIDYIRFQLEAYCYGGKAQIKLYFEDEPTIVSLQHVQTLASAKSDGPGIQYRYDDYIKVGIQPNAFVKGASVCGICNEQETIKEIYEGLLNIGRVGYQFTGNFQDSAWNYDPIVFYNHIKSPIIERYISGIKNKHNSIVERQRIVRHVFTISPNNMHVLGRMTGQSEVVEVMSDDIVTLYKSDLHDELCSVALPGVYNWLSELSCMSGGARSTMDKVKTDDWHLRGLILAKELKKKLPDDIDIWYDFPFDDTEHRDRRPVLVTDGTLKDYFEEELSKACLLKDRKRVDYCLNMDADINANDGSAFKLLIASNESLDDVSEDALELINKEKLDLFEHLRKNGLTINHGEGGIEPVLELCKTWKCDLIEKRIHEIMNSI